MSERDVRTVNVQTAPAFDSGSTPVTPESSDGVESAASFDWSRAAERGTIGALRFGAWFHRAFGRRPMQLLLWAIAVYFYFANRVARLGSAQYFEHLWATPEGRRTLGRRPGAFAIVRHFYSFACSLYDRMVVWGGALDRYSFDHDGSGELFELARQKRGALLLGAHLGSFELLWYLSREYDLAVNVVVFYDNAQRINQFFEALDPEVHVRAIGLDPGSVNAAFEIKACIDRGEFVVMLADRVAPGGMGRNTLIPFLGEPAELPMGPFLLAGALDCPVMMSLCVRTGRSAYRTVLRTLRDSGRVPRSGRDASARELMADYVAALEPYCQAFPYEWFNFYPFWANDGEAT